MGKAAAEYREIRFVIGPNMTDVYVFYQALGDCPAGVQGWHHKAFYGESQVTQILIQMIYFDSPMLWPSKAPEGG